MPLKVIYGKEDELRLAVTVLQESAKNFVAEAARLEKDGVSVINPATGAELSSELRASANARLAAARAIEWSIEGLGNDQPTADEEKEELRKVINDLFEGVGYRLHGTLVEQVRTGVEAVKSQRKEAFGLVATLVDDQRIRLEALRWTMKSALDSPTHASKNARLKLGLEAIEQIINELQKIDPDNIARYTVYDWHTGSWNTRKLNATIYHQEGQIRALRARLEEIQKERKENNGAIATTRRKAR